MDTIFIASSDQQRIDQWQTTMEAAFRADVVVAKDLKSLINHQPALCLIDIDSLAGQDVASLAAIIKENPATKFFLLVAVPAAQDGMHWVKAGAKGYANRLINPSVLQTAIGTIMAGEIWAGRLVVQHLLSRLQQSDSQHADNSLDVLTDREHELARYVGLGLNNRQIAVKLEITERTVKAHLNNIFTKLNISSRLQLALAIQQEKTQNNPKNGTA